DIAALWAENELLVLTSRSEGTPLSLVEALVCGRAAVVTDVGGNASWVKDGETGFVAEGLTAESVGAALERAWRARARWPPMGGRARQQARGAAGRRPRGRPPRDMLRGRQTKPNR